MVFIKPANKVKKKEMTGTPVIEKTVSDAGDNTMMANQAGSRKMSQVVVNQNKAWKTIRRQQSQGPIYRQQ